MQRKWLAWIAFGMSTLVWPAAYVGKGLLLIRFETVKMDTLGAQTNTEVGMERYVLFNLNTKTLYNAHFYQPLYSEEVEEGIYCLRSVYYSDFELPYCGEPYFKVLPDTINNAGNWRFGLNIESGRGTLKLFYGAQDPDSVMALAKQYRKDDLRKYGMKIED